MSYSRIDSIFGDIATNSEIVRIAATILGQSAPSLTHGVSKLPTASDGFTDAPHPLAVGTDRADRSHVVQDVLGGDRLASDAALGERDVLRDVLVEVVAYHEHVEVLIDGVDGERARWICR